jgi:Tol biopolymer transport system component
MIMLTFLIGMGGNANADFIFGEPTNLGPLINSSSTDESPSISADGLILVFVSDRPGGYGEADLWMTTRATTSEPWGEPENLGSPVNTSDIDWCPSLSPDGCTLYYASRRSGGIGNSDIWVTTRATTDDAWGEPVNLGTPVNHSGNDGTTFISEDGLELYFASLFRSGGYGADDLWVSTRETKEDEWGAPMNLGPVVNSDDEELFPALSADGLSLFFSSGVLGPSRSGGIGNSDIWVTRRKTRDDDWGEPVNLGSPVNTSEDEWSPNLSADGSTLYFTIGRFGKGDLYEVSLEPVVDLNSDGIVDAADMSIIIDHWGTDEPLCDIGPMPWGDGIVDVQDLIVLAEHLFEEIPLVEPIE